MTGRFLRVITVKVEDGTTGIRANGLYVFDDGRIMATDTGRHRLLFLDSNGVIESVFGEPGAGPGQFNYPSELAVSESGEVFIVDIMNNRVQVFDLEGNYLRTFGRGGRSAGTFARPSGIAVDAEGNVWVTDKMSGMIQKFDSEGKIVSAIGTNEDDLRFASPHGIFLTDSSLYVVNRLSNKVSVFTLQ